MILDIDYVSDLHLGFYIHNIDSIEEINKLVINKIKPQIKSNILVIAGDINENVNTLCEFMYACSKYYSKVIFILGNHEYYIYGKEMDTKYNHNSMNKVEEINHRFKDNSEIIFLDKTNDTKGIYDYNNFRIAGDTLWYRPISLTDWLFYYPTQSDSFLIKSNLSWKDKILKLNKDSISWYNSLPVNIDLIITHIPPIRNKNNNRGSNACYYTKVDSFKAPVWIYGHDHKENDVIINNTRFISNPWGYNTKEFKIKTLKLEKK